MDNSLERSDLRRRLGARLRQVIDAPIIETKELAAFDIIMSRREVLRNAGIAGAIGGLVAAGVPPTRWGSTDKALHVPASAVGLTPQEQQSVTKAYELSIGTELFQETVYAEPVIPQGEVLSHSLIEGARGRLRLQSALESHSPAESAFLDSGYHWGPPELIQLEPMGNGVYELVHYRHPWGARTDGPTTDSLVRDVIMDGSQLVSPISVHTISSPYNNKYASDGTSSSGVIYVVVVTDHTVSGAGWLCIGMGSWSLDAPLADPGDYPVEWRSWSLGDLNPEMALSTELWAADTYTRAGHVSATSPADYDSTASTEHIVLHYNRGITVISLADTEDRGQVHEVQVFMDWMQYPSSSQGRSDLPRVVHMDLASDPQFGGSSPRYIVLMRSATDSDDRPVHRSWEIDTSTADPVLGAQFWDNRVWVRLRILEAPYETVETTSQAKAPVDGQLVYQNVTKVHGLYTVEDTDGRLYHVKLGNFGGVVALFAIANRGYRLAGHLPLGLPDIAPNALGEIGPLSGGVSKFGGFRFVATDSNENLFLLRQRRRTLDDSPYGPPIYGFNDADGYERTIYSTTVYDGHATIDPNSPIHQLVPWLKASNSDTSNSPAYIATFNVLLNATLAFGTDDTYAAQGAWLGNTFVAAYAPRRFGYDSAHVIVEAAQSGDKGEFAASTMFCHPVHKTWKTRQIATQTFPEGPGLSESGEHYQAMVAPVNAYGRRVSLLSDDNANLLIEVRADVPTTVVDDTHNLYYDVDRYSSFMAAPDPGSGQLGLVIKAETFSQVLYARLVDQSSLQPSASDPAMLAGDQATWQSFDIARQGQQRMGTTGPETVELLGASAVVQDPKQYVSESSLHDVVSTTQLKTSFTNGKSDDQIAQTYGSLASYLNSSGSSLISVSQQLSLGASTDGQTIDPLTAVTVPTTSLLDGTQTLATTFTYASGTVGVAIPQDPGPPDELGSIWSSISHAFHDAVNWLQHATDDAIRELGEGAVEVETGVKGLTAKVTKEIMKFVNGVDDDLNQVVSTVEEYAAIVEQVVVTIVKQTFLYKLIRDIIALISLFVHLQDIGKLRTSLGGSLLPKALPSYTSFDSFTNLAVPAFTSNGTVDDNMGGLDTTDVVDTLSKGFLDLVSGNPFTKKILNKVLAPIVKALEDAAPALPISFNVDSSIADDFVDEIEDLGDALVTGVTELTVEVIEEIIQQIAADVADPKQSYSNLVDGLKSLADDVDVDVLEPVFDWVDNAVTTALSDATTALDQHPFMTIDLTGVADVLNLFGVGGLEDGKYTVSASDAVYWPTAVIIWVAVYTHTGHSVKNIGELDAPTALPGPAPAISTGTVVNLLTLGKLTVDFVVTEQAAISWAITALDPPADQLSPLQKGWLGATQWMNLLRRVVDVGELVANLVLVDGKVPEKKVPDLVASALLLETARLSMAFNYSNLNTGSWGGERPKPKPTDIIAGINTFLTIGVASWDTWEVWKPGNHPSTSDIETIAGSDIARSQPLASLLWKLANGGATELVEVWGAWMVGAPFGFVMQAGVVIKQLAGEDPPAVVLVAGSEQLTSEDTVLLTRLTEHHGARVRIVDDDTLRDASLPTTDLIVVSSSVSRAKVRRRHALRDGIPVRTPLLVCEGRMMRELGFARRSGETRLRGGSIRFADGHLHPAADGSIGLTEVLDQRSGRVNWAAGVGGATVLATEPTRSGRPVYFAYDIGDTRADGTTADARAIGWFLGERGWDDLTDHGWKVFDAAIDWLTGR